MKLQTKILCLLIPVIASPLVALGWVTYYRMEEYSTRTRLDQMDILLEQVGNQVRTKLDTTRANSGLFASSKVLRDYALTESEADRYSLFQLPLLRLFSSYQEAYPDYCEIRVLLPDGTEDTRLAPAELANVTEEEGPTPWFADLKASPKSYFATFGIRPDDGHVVLWAAHKLKLIDNTTSSVLAKPELRGYLVLTVAWRELQDRVNTSRIGQNGYLFFTDSHGRILFQPEHVNLGSHMASAQFQQVRDAIRKGQVTTTDEQGQTFIVNGRQLHPDLYLMAFMPLKEIQQARNNLALLITLTLVVVILLSSGLIFLFFRSVILQPMRKLYLAFKKVGQGNLDTSLTVNKHDEIGKLSHEFNRMTSHLKQATVSRDNVRKIFQNLQDALLVLNDKGVIETINDATSRLFEYSEEDLIGQPIGLIFPEGDTWIVDWIISQVTITNIERDCLTAGKDRLPVEISASALMDEGSHSRRTVVIIRDLTDIKATEAERQGLIDRLHRSQKMEAIGTLAGGVAHDLNNILSGLTSYPELLLMDLPEDSSMRDPLQTIKKSGEKAAHIVQDMLTLARRGVKVDKVVDLNAVIHDYLDSHEYKQILKFHSGVKVTLGLDKQPAYITGFSAQLTKMATNLVSNAAEAMPDGGHLTIRTEMVHLEQAFAGFESIPEGEYACLIVSDTGIGISSEDLPRIFEPFFTKKVMGRSGTGLGMAVVWGTVKDHGGFVNVESVEGQGTTFSIYLPTTQAAVDSTISPSLESYSGQNEKVLIVDDVEEQRIIAQRMLRRLNYDVDAVDGGLAAVAYIKEHQPDLIVLDMIMEPGIDGLETYKRIIDHRPGQKVVIASGYSETGRAETLLTLSDGVYVKKPYSIETLGMAVRRALSNSE